VCCFLTCNCGAIEYYLKVAESNNVMVEPLLYDEDDTRQGSFNFLTYSMSVILDPCRNRNFDCCMDTFGDPEYQRSEKIHALGYVYAVARLTRKVFKCEKPCFGKWEEIMDTSGVDDFSFDAIDSDEVYTWATNQQSGKLYRRLNHETQLWTYISGRIEIFSTSGAHALYGVSGEDTGTILTCIKPCEGNWVLPTDAVGHPNEKQTWEAPRLEQVDMELVDIEADLSHLWIVTNTGRLFSRQVLLLPGPLSWQDVWVDNSPYEQWVEATPPSTVHRITVSVSRKVLWAISSNRNSLLVCQSVPCTGTWFTIAAPDALVDIDADSEFVWVVSVAGQVYKRPVLSFSGHSWVSVPPSNDISAAAVDAWGRVPDGGFSLVTTTSNLEAYGIFNDYLVAGDSRHCKYYSTEPACRAKQVSGCRWSITEHQCELEVKDQRSRLPIKEVDVEDSTCILARTIMSDGTMELSAGYSIVKHSEETLPQVVQDKDCVDAGIRRRLFEERPPCWDYNSTMDASKGCVDNEGNEMSYCMAVGYSSTAYIPQCNDPSRNDCGTFLELHRSSNEEVISQSAVPAKYTHGFRTMTLNTTFFEFEDESSSRIVCYGEYEIWWVQRIGTRRIVEAVKKFKILQPTCDWNPIANKYEIYATVTK